MKGIDISEFQEISDFCIKEWGQGTTINYNKNFPFFGVHIPCENGRKSLKADALILLLLQILKTALQITKEPLQL